MKRIISIILILIMAIGMAIIPSTVNAKFSINSADLYSKGSYSDYLHYGNIGIVFDYVVYSKDGKEYPAYCLNKDVGGVNQNNTYSVKTENLLSDVKVWRAIINGYPYKTIEQLGCATKEEAFLATKQAVYCMIYNREPSEYVAHDEREQRVLNALTQIVSNARSSTEIKQGANLTINDVTNEWKQDEIDKKYISKTYTISANATVDTYTVILENISLEGARIVDEQNNDKNNFKYGENFKILLPITSLKNEGSFNLKASGQVATKPVLYGYSGNSNLQDYAITGNIYEDGSGAKTIYYTENETKIIIIKQDDEGNFLEGVKFNLLNENKEVIYSDLITNKDGKITVKNLTPGKYYIQETATVNGYTIYDEQIEASVAYNESLTVNVTNAKEKVIIEKPEIIEKEMSVVQKLPKTGM